MYILKDLPKNITASISIKGNDVDLEFTSSDGLTHVKSDKRRFTFFCEDKNELTYEIETCVEEFMKEYNQAEKENAFGFDGLIEAKETESEKNS